MTSRRLAMLAVALAVPGVAACSRARARLPVDAGVTFAVHADPDGLVIDRMHDGGNGILASPGWLHTENVPTLVLRSDGEVRAALWVVGRSRVLVREEPSTRSPRTGEVLTSWDDGAVRLGLWARDGSTLRTDTFRREGIGTGAPVLGREAGTGVGVRGTYRATLRDAQGAEVGWMRARIAPDEDVTRAYDAVLPPAVDDGLAAAASVALDAEIGWIEDHAGGASLR